MKKREFAKISSILAWVGVALSMAIIILFGVISHYKPLQFLSTFLVATFIIEFLLVLFWRKKNTEFTLVHTSSVDLLIFLPYKI